MSDQNNRISKVVSNDYADLPIYRLNIRFRLGSRSLITGRLSTPHKGLIN